MIVRALDLETTGLPTLAPNGVTLWPQIIAWAITTWRDGTIVNSEARYFLPLCAVDPEAARVSGYSRGDWVMRGAADMTKLDLRALAGLLSNSILCGHNILNFDLPVLASEFRRLSEPAPHWDPRVIDTQVLAMPLMALGFINNVKLATVAAHFGIDTSNAHDPTWDAWRSLMIWERFVEKTADMFLTGRA